jgi:hypothetical protein
MGRLARTPHSLATSTQTKPSPVHDGGGFCFASARCVFQHALQLENSFAILRTAILRPQDELTHRFHPFEGWNLPHEFGARPGRAAAPGHSKNFTQRDRLTGIAAQPARTREE